MFFARPKVQARLQFLKICKKYQALYKQHQYSPSVILTSESLAIETVSNTSKIPACLYHRGLTQSQCGVILYDSCQ